MNFRPVFSFSSSTISSMRVSLKSTEIFFVVSTLRVEAALGVSSARTASGAANKAISVQLRTSLTVVPPDKRKRGMVGGVTLPLRLCIGQSEPHSSSLQSPTASTQDRLDDVAMHVRQAPVDGVVPQRQLFVVNAHQVQDGGMQIVAVRFPFFGAP